MGRWLDALKKHENADEGHHQNPQKCEGGAIERKVVHNVAQERAEVATTGRPSIVPGGNDKPAPTEADQPVAHSVTPRFTAPVHPNPVRSIMERLEGDMERYAAALKTYGPMSYGQAMRVLGWGGTRAGQAESDLRAAGRIAFNQLGRAYLVDEEAGHDE